MKKSTAPEFRCNRSVPREKSGKFSRSYNSGRGQERREVVSEESSRTKDFSQKCGNETDLEEITDRSCRRSPRNIDWKWTVTKPDKSKKINCEKRIEEDGNFPDSYFEESRRRKVFKNKKTQKNLISPTPSFLPPTSRKGLISQIRDRLPPSRPKDPEAKNFNKVFQSGPENEGFCLHHRQIKQQEQKHLRKRGFLGESCYVSHPTTCDLHERLHSEAQNLQNFGKTHIPTVDVFLPPKNLVDVSESSKMTELASNKHLEYINSEVQETDPGQSSESKKETVITDPIMPQANRLKEVARKALAGRLKEKLVYVVEEDGQNPTKMETDLFTVNEILTIKKDLLELSEFAKKLKKLKEMKRESDRVKKDGGLCHCKPITELLKDINKRIEALEIRQEELEKRKPNGIIKSEAKGDHHSISVEKKEGPGPNLGSNDPNARANPSASSHKIIVNNVEGFNNNSDIVCELMDIKSQLQKLEKRKMSREISAQQLSPPPTKPLPTSNTEGFKKKGHAIAVFSSKTYILATPNNFSRKQDKKCSKNAKDNRANFREFKHDSKERCPPEDAVWMSKTEKTKENVANWLKSVSARYSNVLNDSRGHTTSSTQKEDNKEYRCHKWKTENKYDNDQIQERKQNRAAEREVPEENDDILLRGNNQDMNSKVQKPSSQVKNKKCLLTASGKFFTFGQKLLDSNKTSLLFFNKDQTTGSSLPVSDPLTNLRRCSVSCTSIPSACMERSEKPSRLRNKTGSQIVSLEPSQSKSLQEVHPQRYVSKKDKTPRNVKKSALMRFFDSKENKDKRNKSLKNNVEDSDGLTERSNLEGGDFPVTSSSRSYLVGEINLEKNSESVSGPDRNRDSIINNPQIFSTTAVINPGFELTNDSRLDEIDVIKCKTMDRKFRSKKESKSECRKCKQRVYICKICKKERCQEKKKEKKKKCPAPKKEKKRRVCCLKEIVTPAGGPGPYRCSPIPLRLNDTCIRGRRQCDHHFKSSIFGGSTKCIDCCKKACRHQATDRKPQSCEPLIIKSEDGSDFSFKDYQRRYQVRLEEETIPKSKPPCTVKLVEDKSKDACGLTSFFKNLRGLYPRCSYLKFFPTFGISCEKVEPGPSEIRQENKSRYNKGRIIDSVGEKCRQSYCKSLYGNPKIFCYQMQNRCRGKHGENCGCVKVCPQCLFKNSNEKSKDFSTEISSDPSLEIKQSEDASLEDGNCIRCRMKPYENYMFPYRRHQVYCVENASDYKVRPCNKKERKKCKKLHKKEMRMKKKAEKKEKKLKKKCICLICGNVHKRKKKKKKNKDRHNVTYDDVPCCKTESEPKPPPESYSKDSCQKSSSSMSCACDTKPLPFLSFLTNFCSKKSKKSDRRSPSLIDKFNEVRRMKVCKGRRRCKLCEKLSKKFKKTKKRYRERVASEPSSATDIRNIREKQSKCPSSVDEVQEGHPQSCCIHKIQKKERKKAKHKKKKNRKKCESYVTNDTCQENPTTTFYCTCQSIDRQQESNSTDITTSTTIDTNFTTTTTTTPTTTTTTTDTTTTTITTDQSSEGLAVKNHNEFRFGDKLRQRLSSIPVFWNSFRNKTRRPFDEFSEPNSDYLLADFKRSDSISRIQESRKLPENFRSLCCRMKKNRENSKKCGKMKCCKTK